jgi:hypothetical protein
LIAINDFSAVSLSSTRTGTRLLEWSNKILRALLRAMPSTVFFTAAIFLIAVVVWILRSWVESEPDPFFLNLTFFAFAGQCIRTCECIRDKKLTGVVAFLWLIALFVVLSQVIIMKAHKQTTFNHYKDQLKNNKVDDNCSDREIDHWADALLQITGVDFSPGHYQWLEDLSVVFTEPREKSRENAFSILPPNRFRVAPPSTFTAGSLIVPLDKRQRLWRMYEVVCILSWAVFIAALIFSTRALAHQAQT